MPAAAVGVGSPASSACQRSRASAISLPVRAMKFHHITISSANGSDLRLTLGDRAGLIDDGDLRERGAFGNLPCGEGFIPPIETEGEGTLIVDGTIAGIPTDGPVELRIEGGQLVEASGDAGAKLLATLRAAGAQGTANRSQRTQGPNLDQRVESYEDAIYAIRNGGFSGAIMPQNIVVGEDAEKVARFLEEYSGSEIEGDEDTSTPGP